MPFLEPVGIPRAPPCSFLGTPWVPRARLVPFLESLGMPGAPQMFASGSRTPPQRIWIGFPEDFCASIKRNHARKSGKNPGTNPGPVFFESEFGPRIRMNSGGNSGGNSERNPGGNPEINPERNPGGNPGRNSGINSGGSSESNSGGNSGSNAERNSGGNPVGQFDEQFGFAAKQQKALIRIPETLDRSFPKIGTLGLQKVKG